MNYKKEPIITIIHIIIFFLSMWLINDTRTFLGLMAFGTVMNFETIQRIKRMMKQ